MIYTSVTVRVNNNGTATSNNKVVLYRGDREVEIQITLAGNPFIVQDSTYAQLIIRRPDASPIITGVAPLKDSKVILTITEQNIDELTEVGSYGYQIRLYDDDMSARITLPPVENGLEVREPIVDEASGAIGRAMINYSLISRARAIDDNATFNEYDEYNRTYWADGDFITDVKMNKIEDALYTINQRVLSDATTAYITTNMQEDQKIGIGETLDISFEFSSPNLGRGTLKVAVDGVQKMSMYVEQEETTITLTEDYFKKGTNKLTLHVVDRAGKMSNELIFNVRYGSTEILSDFDSYSHYQYGASVRYYFTPISLDTSMELTFYMVIDGEIKPGMSCTSDVRGYYTFPNNLSIGAHYCQAYIIDGEGNQSNILEFNLIILDSYSIVIASDTRNPVIEEGAQLVLDYKVYMQYADTFITKTYVDGNLVNTGECGLATSYYRTTSLTEGTHTIRIEAWDMEERVHDYVTWTVTVTASTFERIMPATSGAIFMASASDKTNSDADRDKWVGKDQDNQNVTAQLYDFSYNNESGWVDNELILSGNSYVIVPVRPLAENARYGFTLDLEFTSRAIGVEDALVLELWDRTKNCGIKITTEQLILRSAEGNECSLYFENDANTSVMFVIDRNEAKAKIYLNGVMCSAFHLSDYDAGGTKVLEDFSVNADIKLGGSGYSKIRNLRVYQIALTTTEILNNYISNKMSKEEQKELVKFQNGDGLPTLTVYCDFSGLGKDDKKPCKIVYVSTDEEKYGKSFTLDHYESQLQYQGTSSMAYPIKNYRLNLRDENGDKLYYDFPFGKPECRFTLKADFMSSGHWQNTGLTKWINDNLYNYNPRDEKSMNPKKWYDINNGGSLTDTRECIYGFPCRLILVNDGSTPLNSGQNEPTPGNTKDMGIFNFNNDKDNTDTMGFDQDNFPNCMSFEVTANSDTSAGAFMSFHHHYSIQSNNSNLLGRYLSSVTIKVSDLPPLPWKVKTFDNSLRIIRGAGNVTGEVTVRKNSTVTIDTWDGDNIVFRCDDEGRIKNVYFHLNEYECEIDRTGGNNPIELVTDQSDELAYYQQSFEMRFPDPEDYNDWHGYLGINAGTMVTDYKHTDEGYSTTFWNWEETRLSISSSTVISKIECYYNDNLLAAISFNKDVGTATLIDGSNKIRLIFTEIPEEFYIGDTKYIFGNEIEEITLSDPYLGEEISPNYGLKRVIEWTDRCSDAEFVRDFEKYYHKDYTLRYFLLVMALGMVDNLGKNMMFDSWDGQIWAPRFYDCDTICSYDNSGDIKFDVDIEMEQGYWNTSSSRLWTRVRDLMHNDLVAKYNDMRQNGLSFESLMSYFYGEQISKIPQKYYNMDFDVKYAPFGESYMGMAHGDGLEHLKRWLKNRLMFTDTLYDYAPSYGEAVTIRANTTEPMTLYIETYTPVYQHLSWFNGQMDKKKIDGKVAVAFTGTAMAATDQEVLIYGGSNIKRITGISSTNPNQILTANAPRLVELDASNSPLLSDLNMNKANLSSNTYLNRVNLRNCPLLGGNLRVNNSPLLREIDIRGTAIDGLMLPSSVRNLEVMRLPNAIRAITLNDATALHTLEFDPGVRMDSISMSNCNKLTNLINFDLLQTPVISLDNSYNTAKELYFKDTTDLTLRNMSNLERVIYTPNNEYDVFDMSKVTGAPNYKISTFNCPKLSTFMTTAPYRESYNNGCGTAYKDVETLGDKILVEKYSPNGESFIYEDIRVDFDNGGHVELEVDLSKCAANNENIISFGNSIHTWTGSSKEFHIYYTAASSNMTIFDAVRNIEVKDIAVPKITTIRLDSDGLHINGVKYCENSLLDLYSFDVGSQEGSTRSKAIYNYIKYSGYFTETIPVKAYGAIQPNKTFTANNLDISSSQFTDVKLLCTTDVNVLKLPSSIKNFYCDSSFDLDTNWIEDGDYDVVHNELIEQYTTDYEGEVLKTNYQVIPMAQGGVLTEQLTVGQRLDSGWTIVSGVSDHSITGKIPATGSIVVDTSYALGFRMYVYDKDDNILYDYSKNWSESIPIGRTTFDISDDARYIIASFSTSTLLAERTDLNLYLEVGSRVTPNIIPSSADGSLIFSMYAPEKTSAPASGTWDLHGLQFNNFHTYGMNNDVKSKSRYQCRSHIHPNNNLGIIKPIPLDSVKELMVDIINESGARKGFYLYGFTDSKYEVWNDVYGNFMYGPIDIKAEALRNDPTTKYLSIYFINDDNYTMYINGDEYLLPTERTYADTTTETWSDLVEVLELSMPARYDDYNISIRNAYIAPTKYNTMLYPLLVNEDSPITGYLNYFNYGGDYLSWSFAYVQGLGYSLTIIQPQTNLINTYKYKYNAFYETDYEFDNPYEVARYTASASGVRPSFDTVHEYTVDETANPDGSYKVVIYTNDLDPAGRWLTFDGAANRDKVLRVDKFVNKTGWGIFRGCSSLTYVDVSHMDCSTSSEITFMFDGCKKLNEIKGIENWDTRNVTEMGGVFVGCENLTTLDLSGWDTSKVETMYRMFANCYMLREIKGMEDWDVSKVTNMAGMFNSCRTLPSLNLSKWETDSLTNMDCMFSYLEGAKTIDVTGWNTSKVTIFTGGTYAYSGLFNGCYSLKELKGVGDWDVSKVANMYQTFAWCPLETLDLSKWNSASATNMKGMFNSCKLLTSVDLTGLNTSKVTDMENMFVSCEKLVEIKGIADWDVGNVTNISYMFNNCKALQTWSLGKWDTKNIQLMQQTFRASSLPDNSGIEQWSVPNFGGFYYTFCDCQNITKLDLSNWAKDMPEGATRNCEAAFYMSKNLKTVNLTNWDRVQFSKFTGTFQACSALEEVIGVENLNVSQVQNMSHAFNGCASLLPVDLRKWNVSNATNMQALFSNCDAMVTIDISGWDTSKVTNFNEMFYECSALEKIKGNIVFNNASAYGMFRGCGKGPDLSELYMSGVVNSMNYIFNGFGFETTPIATSIDLSNITLVEGVSIPVYTFSRCTVSDIYPPTNLTADVDLGSTTLSKASLLRFINNLMPVESTKRLILGPNINMLTEGEIAVAANKGWTVQA